jgi:hypothetical protein
LPRTGPGYGRQRGLVRATERLRGSIPSANRSATVIRAHRGPVAESRVRNGMVASAPRVDMGPGPPATACRKCRTATSHDELPDGSACVTVCRGMQRSPQERLRPLPFSGLHVQEQWVCAHVETRPALTQVVSKRRKLHCRLLNNVPETKQSRTMAQRGRCGEAEHVFAVAFRSEMRGPRSA